MKTAVIIPARYASTRLPGKPLALIAGRPLIQHVYERAAAARGIDAVVVATDGDNNESLDPTRNTISFTGNVSFSDVGSLPATSDYPASLRQLTGALLLVPGFGASFGGNFNTIGGSIIASQLTFSGNAGGTVKGSIVNLNKTAVSLSGNSDLIIESQGTANYPPAVKFGSSYSPLPYTYTEGGL